VETAPGMLPEEESDPEAELRARLILYQAHRDAGRRLQAEALLRYGLFRREPSAAAAAAIAGARPPDAPPLDAALLGLALAGLVRIAPPVELPPEVIRRTVTLTERAAFIRDAIMAAGASPIVLQELLRGVRDRVVVAVTFLAMLELMKRREIVVSQAAPWGPIVARATTSEERMVAGRTRPLPTDEPLDETLESFS
jgi:segregation and condensation protein A